MSIRSSIVLCMMIQVSALVSVTTGWAQSWQELSNQERHAVTSSTEWEAMEQSLVSAGYIKAVQHERGYKRFVDHGNGYWETVVESGYRNPASERLAVPRYLKSQDAEGQPFEFWAYTVLSIVDEIVVDETFTWDTPAVIGDNTRLFSILKGYTQCVLVGLSASLARAGVAGAYDGDSFMPSLLGGVAATYATCITGAYLAWRG